MEAENIDALVQETEHSSNQEIPMSNDGLNAADTQPQAEAQPQEYSFKYQGQEIKAPVEKMLKWASMGYGAPQRIGELSRKLQEFEDKSKQFDSYEKTYAPIDQWARQNPDKWQALLQAWQQAQYGQPGQQTNQAQQSVAQLPPELVQKIQNIESKFQNQEQKERVQEENREDQRLAGDIVSIRKQFSNIDFDAPDERGNSLEYRVLEHATRMGIPSFRAAFRDYYFDKLTQSSEHKGREAAARTISPQTRAGLLGGKNQAPAKGKQPDLKGRNYDQIHEMVLEELGLG